MLTLRFLYYFMLENKALTLKMFAVFKIPNYADWACVGLGTVAVN